LRLTRNFGLGADRAAVDPARLGRDDTPVSAADAVEAVRATEPRRESAIKLRTASGCSLTANADKRPPTPHHACSADHSSRVASVISTKPAMSSVMGAV